MITKEPINKQKFIKHLFYFNSARKAFEFILKNTFKHNDVILMPSYIGESDKEGSGVFDPIRNTHTKYLFYKLTNNLVADLCDIKNKIRLNRNIRAVLLIHYFGFPQEIIFEVKKICEQYNILLIEDCAHCLQSKYKNFFLGSIGDFSFYSIHKLISTNDGGILQINNSEFFYLKPKENLMNVNTLKQFINTKLNDTSKIRRENFRYYLKKIPLNMKYCSIMYNKIISGVVPLNFPILIKNINRYKYYNILIDKGVITVSLYYRIIKEISCSEFKKSFCISNEILNLPVHQDITFSDIDFIISKMIEIENEY